MAGIGLLFQRAGRVSLPALLGMYSTTPPSTVNARLQPLITSLALKQNRLRQAAYPEHYPHVFEGLVNPSRINHIGKFIPTRPNELTTNPSIQTTASTTSASRSSATPTSPRWNGSSWTTDPGSSSRRIRRIPVGTLIGSTPGRPGNGRSLVAFGVFSMGVFVLLIREGRDGEMLMVLGY